MEISAGLLGRRTGSVKFDRNEILFDEQGNYAGFDRSAPTSASGGKPKVLRMMWRALIQLFVCFLFVVCTACRWRGSLLSDDKRRDMTWHRHN